MFVCGAPPFSLLVVSLARIFQTQLLWVDLRPPLGIGMNHQSHDVPCGLVDHRNNGDVPVAAGWVFGEDHRWKSFTQGEREDCLVCLGHDQIAAS
jgi:hypothetical protein